MKYFVGSGSPEDCEKESPVEHRGVVYRVIHIICTFYTQDIFDWTVRTCLNLNHMSKLLQNENHFCSPQKRQISNIQKKIPERSKNMVSNLNPDATIKNPK